MKRISISRHFLQSHPRKGEPTFFVEKVMNAVHDNKPTDIMAGSNYYPCVCTSCEWRGMSHLLLGGEAIADTGDHEDCVCPDCGSAKIDEINWEDWEVYYSKKYSPKLHTFRGALKKVPKPGDWVRIYCWEGKPYRSKTVFITEVELQQVLQWELKSNQEQAWLTLLSPVILEMKTISVYNTDHSFTETFRLIALNDGFENPKDLLDWLCSDRSKRTDGDAIGGVLLIWGDVNYV